jgi:hypothetical protein
MTTRRDATNLGLFSIDSPLRSMNKRIDICCRNGDDQYNVSLHACPYRNSDEKFTRLSASRYGAGATAVDTEMGQVR